MLLYGICPYGGARGGEKPKMARKKQKKGDKLARSLSPNGEGAEENIAVQTTRKPREKYQFSLTVPTTGRHWGGGWSVKKGKDSPEN